MCREFPRSAIQCSSKVQARMWHSWNHRISPGTDNRVILTSPAQMRQVDFSNYVIRNFAEALCPIILGMLWIQFWAFLMFCARQNWGSDIPYTLPTSTTPRTDQTEAAKNNAQHKSTNIKHDVLRICIILCPRISHTSYGANYLHCRFLRRQWAKLI